MKNVEEETMIIYVTGARENTFCIAVERVTDGFCF